jgi:hypothetical protein
MNTVLVSLSTLQSIHLIPHPCEKTCLLFSILSDQASYYTFSLFNFGFVKHTSALMVPPSMKHHIQQIFLLLRNV